MGKKFMITEINGEPYVLVRCWEEEQEALLQGHSNILAAEKEKRGGRKRKRWLSGRCRYQRYDGIFQF